MQTGICQKNGDGNYLPLTCPISNLQEDTIAVNAQENPAIGLPGEAATSDIPTCSVCLEKMEDNVLIILCNHTFHAECLQKWTDTTYFLYIF